MYVQQEKNGLSQQLVAKKAWAKFEGEVLFFYNAEDGREEKARVCGHSFSNKGSTVSHTLVLRRRDKLSFRSSKLTPVQLSGAGRSSKRKLGWQNFL